MFQSLLQAGSHGSVGTADVTVNVDVAAVETGKSLGSVGSTAVQTGKPNIIQVNTTMVGPEPPQVGSNSFSLTQDGGWIAAVVVYSHLVLLLVMSGKLMNLLWKAEGHHKQHTAALQQIGTPGAA